MSPEKLRGGFYSPDILVDMCLRRASAMLTERTDISVLEPSAGDGAFIRGLIRSGLADRVARIEAVEVVESEAWLAARVLQESSLRGRVVHDNVLLWDQTAPHVFDLLLANPPYVRFQFVSDADKQRAREVSARLGIPSRSVSNLWITVLMLSLARLKEGGVFAVILPTEFLTGVSASAVRAWLLTHSTQLTIDLFAPGSFPSVLQEVLVLSGRVVHEGARRQCIVEFHDHNGVTRSWSHSVDVGEATWTAYLLTPAQNLAFTDARSMSGVRRLGELAKFSVSTVTGANAYFCVDSDTLLTYGLATWAVPMLPKIRYAKGLILNGEDLDDIDNLGLPAWMLSFAAGKPSPESHDGARKYLQLGLEQGIDKRYKCRVRAPWFRVPVVPPGGLLLSKRSDRYPKVVQNDAGAVTTDTIYRGQMLPSSEISERDFASSFHNSLTILSAEVSGRSFGGGVLELVPSEISALLMPVLAGSGRELANLDRIAREASDPENLVEATDEMLCRTWPDLGKETLNVLGEARRVLMERRVARTQPPFYE